MKQLCFSQGFRASTTHGGKFSLGKRKTARPIATRRPLHLVVRSSQAKGDKSFLHPRHVRFMKVEGSKKGKPSKSRFWDLLPFTRIVEWGRAYGSACRYIELNVLEGLGLVKRFSKNSTRAHPS